MPNRIPDDLLEASVFMYPTKEDAEDSVQVGGTGFLISTPYANTKTNEFHLYVVTNWHVVNEVEGGCLFVRLNDGNSKKFTIIQTERHHWKQHPLGDDVAVCRLEVPEGADFTAIPTQLFLTDFWIKKLNVGPGDEVCLIGRFIGHDGKARNLPSTRFGNIAMMPDEPIKRPIGLNQESYVIEMHSLSGYSGSPAFLYIDNSLPRPGRDFFTHSANYALIGVNWGHLKIYQPVMIYDESKKKYVKHPDGLQVETNSAMAGVVPAWKILDIINDSDMVAARAKIEGNN